MSRLIIIGSHWLIWTYYTNNGNRMQLNKLNRLGISTGRRQTSGVCTSTTMKLNQRIPAGTNPGGVQRRTRTQDRQISNLVPLPLSLPNYLKSGIPLGVLIPAPAITMMFLHFSALIRSTISSTDFTALVLKLRT